MKKKWNPAGKIIIVIFVLLLAVIFGKTTMDLYAAKKEAEKEASLHQPEEGDRKKDVLSYNGKTYRRNTAIRAILCIGVDSSGEMTGDKIAGTAGQADGIFLVAQDMARDQVKILMIPRDTMTEITFYDLSGNIIAEETQHLTLAFAYGDGREKSCELVVKAVSKLLNGLKIDGYLAMNTSMIGVLNDKIGGVEVTIEEEGMEKRDPSMKKGESLTLKGKQAEIFVRYRDISRSQTALERMERQKLYMEKFLIKAKAKAAEDSSLAARLMETVQKDMVTNMAKDQYMDMGLAILNSSQKVGENDFITLPGEGVETDMFDEYHPDEEKILPLILELFYKEIR